MMAVSAVYCYIYRFQLMP